MEKLGLRSHLGVKVGFGEGRSLLITGRPQEDAHGLLQGSAFKQE